MNFLNFAIYLLINMKKNNLRAAFLLFCLFGFVCGLTQCRQHFQETVIDEPMLTTNVYKWSNGGDLPDSALTYINEFYRQASEKQVANLDRIESINRFRDLATALKARYFYYHNRNDFPEAYKNIQEELDIAQQSGDTTLISDAIFTNGQYLFMQGYYWDALEYFLRLTEMNIPTDQKVSLLYTLGQTYYSIYDQENEYTPFYYALAKEEMQKPDFTKTHLKGYILFGEASLYSNMDDAHLYEFHPLSPSLADSLRIAVRLHEEANLYFEEPINDCAAALSLAILGNTAQSRVFEQKAFELAQKLHGNSSMVYYISALIRYREKKYSEAIPIAAKGLEIASANGTNSDAMKNAKVLYHSYAASGDYSNAYKYLKMADKIQEDILLQEKESRLIMAHIKYDTKIKGEQLQKEKERNKIYRLRIIYTSGASILLLIALGIYNYMYRQKQKTYRLLVQKDLQWAETHFTSDTLVSVEDVLQAEEVPEIETGPDEVETDSPDIYQYWLMQKVYALLENEKLYKDSDLSLEILARHTNTNVRYLSHAINNITHTNFKTFINKYRIKEAILLISNKSPDQSFDEIADMCGFNDRSTFYRSFKKETSVTPKTFKQFID
jgi:AraC-like DNA-binding protein